MLVADSIGKSFSGRRVLSSARVSSRAGEVVGLLGRMGSGKSTLLKICAGLLQPDSGWIELDGRRYDRPRRRILASSGLFYLGESDNLAWTLTVREHFDELRRRYGCLLDGATSDSLDLHELLNRKISTLSGGEVKRVEVALAFARKPKCFLADELFRSADPLLCEALGRALRSLAGDGCAVVVTGHEVNALMPCLDSVTWVTSGTTYSLGHPRAAQANHAFVREYLVTSSALAELNG